jgi:hypothetical protein
VSEVRILKIERKTMSTTTTETRHALVSYRGFDLVATEIGALNDLGGKNCSSRCSGLMPVPGI